MNARTHPRALPLLALHDRAPQLLHDNARGLQHAGHRLARNDDGLVKPVRGRSVDLPRRQGPLDHGVHLDRAQLGIERGSIKRACADGNGLSFDQVYNLGIFALKLVVEQLTAKLFPRHRDIEVMKQAAPAGYELSRPPATTAPTARQRTTSTCSFQLKDGQARRARMSPPMPPVAPFQPRTLYSCGPTTYAPRAAFARRVIEALSCAPWTTLWMKHATIEGVEACYNPLVPSALCTPRRRGAESASMRCSLSAEGNGGHLYVSRPRIAGDSSGFDDDPEPGWRRAIEVTHERLGLRDSFCLYGNETAEEMIRRVEAVCGWRVAAAVEALLEDDCALWGVDT